MRINRQLICASLIVLLGSASSADAQLIKQKFADVILGTEITTLIPNGDFELNDGNNDPTPDNWTGGGPVFVTNDTLGGLVPNYDAGSFVAKAEVTPLATSGGYFQTVPLALAANTDYVLSAYMWNLSDPTDSTRQWNMNVDLSDVPTDPQLRLFASDPQADDGYFAYHSFNTADTGVNVLVRVFFDAPGGATTGWPHQPIGALWDRIAITPASEFQVPVPEPSSFVLAALASIGAVLWGWGRRRVRPGGV